MSPSDEFAAAEKRLTAARKALAAARATGTPQEAEVATRDHAAAALKWQDARLAAKVAAGNERAAAERAATEQAERERQATLPGRQEHIPGRFGSRKPGETMWQAGERQAAERDAKAAAARDAAQGLGKKGRGGRL